MTSPVAVEARASRALRAKIRMASAGLDDAARALWTHPQFARVYPSFLFHNHAVVRASVPLMKAACQAARDAARDDAVAAPLAEYLARHIPEEMHHDDWVLEDLEVLGVARSDILRRMPPAAVATLVGAQYYWCLHHHPVAVLGYIAVLEGTPPEAEKIHRVARASGVPIAAFSTLLKHAALDPYHRDDLDRLIDCLVFTPQQWSLIGLSAFQTIRWLTQVVLDSLA